MSVHDPRYKCKPITAVLTEEHMKEPWLYIAPGEMSKLAMKPLLHCMF